MSADRSPHSSRLRRSYPAPNRLQQLRESKGLSVAEFSRLVGVTAQEIGYLETGKRQLTVAWLKRLAVALQCTPWSIVTEQDVSNLSPDEQQLILAYRRMTIQAQAALLVRIVGGVDLPDGQA